MKLDRPTCNVTLSLKGDLTGLLLWGGLHLTCIVKTNSPCLSSHDEDVNIFQFQQATVFTATLLFQPQFITTLYIQLQMIIYKPSVCCFRHMHTDIISYTTYSWDARNLQANHHNKRQYFTESFLIRSVRCKHDHVWRSLLFSPLFLLRLTTAVIGFLSSSGSRYTITFLIRGCIMSIPVPNITRWYVKLLM